MGRNNKYAAGNVQAFLPKIKNYTLCNQLRPSPFERSTNIKINKLTGILNSLEIRIQNGQIPAG